jgi:predicted transcriptional regulator
VQTNVLLSIKPEFAERIFSGLKRFEFRRVLFKSTRVKRVVVYVSSPVRKVVGEFEVEDILACTTKDLWSRTKAYAGIEKSYYDAYFESKSIAFAIKIKNAKRYPEPLALSDVCRSSHPPQSFMYLD